MEEGLTHNYIIPFANEIVSEQPWVMQSKLQICHVQLHTPGQQNAFEESGLSKLSMFLYVHGSTVQTKKNWVSDGSSLCTVLHTGWIL